MFWQPRNNSTNSRSQISFNPPLPNHAIPHTIATAPKSLNTMTVKITKSNPHYHPPGIDGKVIQYQQQQQFCTIFSIKSYNVVGRLYIAYIISTALMCTKPKVYKCLYASGCFVSICLVHAQRDTIAICLFYLL